MFSKPIITLTYLLTTSSALSTNPNAIALADGCALCLRKGGSYYSDVAEGTLVMDTTSAESESGFCCSTTGIATDGDL